MTPCACPSARGDGACGVCARLQPQTTYTDGPAKSFRRCSGLRCRAAAYQAGRRGDVCAASSPHVRSWLSTASPFAVRISIAAMKFPRSSGILLHPTSLPGRYGIGDFGPEAHRFAEFLANAGQKLWQVLPLGPTGYGDSPYQLFSAFAGNPLLISLDELIRRGLLAESDWRRCRRFLRIASTSAR